MTMAKSLPIQRDWFSKTLAGTLLGLTLALECSGVFVRLNPSMAEPVRAQLAMWMVAPIWLGTLGGTYLFSSGWRAWLWLAGGNMLVVGALILMHLFHL